MTTLARTLPSDVKGAARWWQRCEAPTLVLAVGVYAAWAALVYWHAAMGTAVLFVLGGCIAQLHSSLQHEAIHAMRRIPRLLRWALVWPPLNLWLPYPLYHRSHSVHHVNFHLTHPQKDSESVYHSAAAWADYGPVRRAVIAANQTLVFRLIAGPWLCLGNMARSELRRCQSGDFSHLGIWLMHAVSVAPILWFVVSVSDMSLGLYVLCFVYPGMMLGALRSFTEHRWDDSPHERVAIVESNPVFGLLFLNNNLHHVHHRCPTMPWYEIPGHFRRNRAAMLDANGHFYYRGYWQIVRRYLWRPIFEPVHPQW
ncbi:fatty acid desaturase [Variovorax sp. J31P207]|uniref:fatty acid desaturase n=1 Tax=Variovorax sp. J31P207 TaxID=3053510 RepID=UPI0025764EDE|nr:fatty acid desaturase [Variovorax sp. J31P207]MDM0066432.1 fatty acid desaturase [Variovorax sp. J31P207]